MRVLHVIASMDPVSGGPSQGVRNLEYATRDKDVVREVVCLDAPDASYLGSDEFEIHAIGPGRGPWQYAAGMIPWLTTNLSRFDVIIINGLWLYHSYAAWKAIRIVKKRGGKVPRVLVMPNGMLDPYFQKAKERRLKAIRNWVYWKLIERKVVNDADGLLFTCETELLLARETFKPYHPRKEYNVGYGIVQPPAFDTKMTAAFISLCKGLDKNPYLLFLSRIHPKKGIDLLVDAFINLHEQNGTVKEKIPFLVIAGPGLESDYASQLKEKLSGFPDVEAKVLFPGMLTGDAKWGAFYGCEAFALPSHQENFGIAVAEALACGKPVLITDQVNIWREISAEGAGLVGADTLTGIQNMLQKWIDLPIAERRSMRQIAVKTFQDHFDVNKIAENYIAAFKDHS